MSKYLMILLVVVLLLAACAPQGGPVSGTPSSVQPAAPQPIEVPEAQDFFIPETPTPEFRTNNPEVSAVLDSCGTAYQWGSHILKTCKNHSIEEKLTAGTLFAVGSVAYATNAAALTGTGIETAGLVISGSEVIGFFVIAAEAALPAVIVGSAVALPVISLLELANQPDPSSNPLLQSWIQNRQAGLIDKPAQSIETAPADQIIGQAVTQQMGGVYDWVDFSSIPVVAEGMTMEVDWNNWGAGPLISTRHPESSQLIRGMLLRADRSSGEYILRSNKPGGCTRADMSHGTICLYAGINQGTPSPHPTCPDCVEGFVIGQLVITKYTSFMAIAGAVKISSQPMGPEWMDLGNNHYMLKSSMFWTCAWWLSERVANGHGLAPEQFWLDAGAGWDRVEMVKARYGAVWPIARVTLPSWNG